jgi:hypothetical protein
VEDRLRIQRKIKKLVRRIKKIETPLLSNRNSKKEIGLFLSYT